MGVEDFWFGVFMACVAIALPAACMTNACTNKSWQDYTVKEGKAEYYLDNENNKAWRWKP